MTDTWNSIQDRVERGAALLDTVYHRWTYYVVPDSLDMADPRRCVLGQLYGTFGEGREQLFGTTEDALLDGADPVFDSGHHGFDTDGEDSYAMLQDAWLNLLQDRRA